MGNLFSSHLEVGNMMAIKGLQFLPSLWSACHQPEASLCWTTLGTSSSLFHNFLSPCSRWIHPFGSPLEGALEVLHPDILISPLFHLNSRSVSLLSLGRPPLAANLFLSSTFLKIFLMEGTGSRCSGYSWESFWFIDEDVLTEWEIIVGSWKGASKIETGNSGWRQKESAHTEYLLRSFNLTCTM